MATVAAILSYGFVIGLVTLETAAFILLSTLIALIESFRLYKRVFKALVIFSIRNSIGLPERAMESLATSALSALKTTSTPVDVKIRYLTGLKQEIKHRHCPEAAIPTLFQVIRLSLAGPHLGDAAFSILGHLTKRLLLQDLHAPLHSQSVKLFTSLYDRLGDQKDRIRQRAVIALSDIYSISEDASKDVEQFVRDTVLPSKNPRVKESGMHWVLTSHKEKGMLFRTFVPPLVDCLEDADGNVRKTAQNTIIELFQNAGIRSTNDLQKRLEERNVRKAIVAHITAELKLASPLDPELPPSNFKNGGGPQASQPSQTRKPQNFAASTPNEAPVEALPMSVSEQEAIQLEPIYVESTKVLDENFREIQPWFEGKEEEHNWLRREKSVLKLRRITKGNAPQDFPGAFNSNVKGLLDGILKTVNSLRTTVCTIGCHLVQDLARVCGSGLDNMVEILLQNLIKLCGNTKKISASKANDTVSAILANVSYHNRLLQHTHYACQDKNVQPRTFACGWLKTIISKHGYSGTPIEHSGGLDLIEKCIKSGLTDSNPGVRERMRGTYWAFARVWSERSETIMSGLDPKAQGLLIKDAANPSPHTGASSTAAAPGKSIFSKSTGSAPTRPSIKEAIAAQKRAKAAGKALPERPGSAESFVSPARPAPPTRPATAMSTASRHVSTQSSGSLASAPVRPRRGVNITRPTTADSSTNRRIAKTETPQGSPATSPGKSKLKTPGLVTGPIKLAPKKTDSPATSPAGASWSKRVEYAEPSPTKAAEDFTMVIPNFKNASESDIGQQSLAEDVPRRLSPPKILDRNDFALRNTDAQDTTHSASQQPLAENISPRLSPQKILDRNDFALKNTDAQDNIRSASPTKLINEISQMSINEDIPSPMSIKDLGNGRVSPIKNTQRVSMSPRTIVSRKETLLGRNNYLQDQRPLKVYEDHSHDTASRSHIPIASSRSPRVLEELPVNEPPIQNRMMHEHQLLAEQHQGATPDYHRDWKDVQHKEQIDLKHAIGSEISENPLYARRTLDSGIVRIQARSLDVLGFRKLQTVVRTASDSIWEDGYKFEELLMPLLEYLESPNDDSSLRNMRPSDSKPQDLKRAQDLKAQALFTLRLMHDRYPKYFAAFYPQALCAILTARKHHPSTSHIVCGLEEVAETLVEHCDPDSCIDSVSDLLDVDRDAETRTMGLYVLAGLLHRGHEDGKTSEPLSIEDGQRTLRLGEVAARFLDDTDPNIRRAVIEFVIELHDSVEEDKFWGLLKGSKEDHRGLITYYLARHRAVHP